MKQGHSMQNLWAIPLILFYIKFLLNMVILSFLSLFGTPHFWWYSFSKIVPLKYRINQKINLYGKVISSCLGEYKLNLHTFLQTAGFYK